MADIQFDEPSFTTPKTIVASRTSWLSGLVIKTGLAKDEAGAQRVLLIVLVIVILAIIAVWLFTPGASSSVQGPPSPPGL